MNTFALLATLLCVPALPAPLSAQQPPAATVQQQQPGGVQQPGGFDYIWAASQERVDANHFVLSGSVEIWRGETRFNADRVDYYDNTGLLVASGHVQMTGRGSVIAADRMELNTKTETGTFYNAWGMAVIGKAGTEVNVLFGGAEPDMYFEGEKIEKIGSSKYKLTKGRFTTCVQPVPRWQLTSGSVVINLDHYAMLTNPVMWVKGIPVFYLPIIYYPIKKENRATGFLLPTYGNSTLRGFTLNNAFFWAIDRSQDLTFYHDFFKRTGQGVGAQYRYVRTDTSRGDVQVYMLNQRALPTTDFSGNPTITPASRSYQMRGSVNETLTPHIRVGTDFSYFTNLVTQQAYNQNILDASRSNRTVNANIAGNWGAYTVRGSYEHSQVFVSSTDSLVSGAAPRVDVSRAEQPLFNLPVYLAFASEWATLDRGSTSAEGRVDTSLSRFDFYPIVRMPFSKLSFLSINTSVSWRGTFWTRSWEPTTHAILDQSVSRQLFHVESRITGPVFNRIFDTSGGSYAEKLKHTIEPFMDFAYTSSVPEFDRIVQWETIDLVPGGTGQVTYGVNNRLYAKRKHGSNAQQATEIVELGISQTYYTNPAASRFDPQYSTTFTLDKAYNFSPVAITLRATPTEQADATARAEIDTRYRILRNLSVNGNYNIGERVRASAGWNLTRIVGEGGIVDPRSTSQFMNGALAYRKRDNRYGTNYSLNWDVHSNRLVQQRVSAFYNAQCCGFTVEYQTFDFGTLPVPGLPTRHDNRFNFSFTLAGIGNFSNFFGALGGTAVR